MKVNFWNVELAYIYKMSYFKQIKQKFFVHIFSSNWEFALAVSTSADRLSSFQLNCQNNVNVSDFSHGGRQHMENPSEQSKAMDSAFTMPFAANSSSTKPDLCI